MSYSCHPCQQWWQGGSVEDQWCSERAWSAGLVALSFPSPPGQGSSWNQPAKLGEASWQLHKAALEHVSKAERICTRPFPPVWNSGAIVSHFAVRYTWLTANAPSKEAGILLPRSSCNTVNKYPQGQIFFSLSFSLFLFYSSLIRSTADSAIYKSVPPKGIRFIFAKWMCGFYYAWQVWLESK